MLTCVSYDLAPSQIAKPLPSFEKSSKHLQKGKKDQARPLKRKRDTTSDYKEDDTPREFARLMQRQVGAKQRSGLDDGESRASKRKKKQQKSDDHGREGDRSSKPADGADSEKSEQLKILPGERLADFAARVNQAMPVAGLSKKGKHVEGTRERQTKTEKRLHKMYAEWRQEEARRKEKLEELQEQQEEQEEEKEAELGGQSIRLSESGRKAKRKRMVGEVNEDDEDPWAILKSKREAPKGLHDVVQAPPVIKTVPKEKFKVRNGAKIDVSNVPAAAGSLKRREELGEARKEVIERYRALMKGTEKP